MSNLFRIILFIVPLLLASCGGGGSETNNTGPEDPTDNTVPEDPTDNTEPDTPTDTVPDAPTQLTVNTGDKAISIGWNEPNDDGGATITSYEVDITPAVATDNILINGTHALIANLTNDTEYQVSVAAVNSVGTSVPSSAVTATPTATDNANYTELTINGDPGSPSGIYDPSLLRGSDNTLWLSYSSVNYYLDASDNVVQDVGTRVAKSSDNGLNFDYVATVATPSPTTVTDSDPGMGVCGSTACTGRWVYETSWLVEDASDPDPSRRFKLFAHKYFLYPAAELSKAAQYHLGAIVMWTASSPDGAWSDETVLLGWPRTAAELSPQIDITSLSSELANCFVAAEGGAAIYNDALYMAFACPYFDSTSSSFPQKIVLIRSDDHAASFEYVSTLLTTDDVLPGIQYFSAPALISSMDSAPILLVTPVISGFYVGSMVYPIAALEQGILFSSENKALAINFVPVEAEGHFGGASSYARDTQIGVVQSDAMPGAAGTAADILLNTQFRILTTKVMASQ